MGKPSSQDLRERVRAAAIAAALTTVTANECANYPANQGYRTMLLPLVPAQAGTQQVPPNQHDNPLDSRLRGNERNKL